MYFFCQLFLVVSKKSINFAPAKCERKVGRVIDRAGLEIRYTPFGYRGFESLTFRKMKKEVAKTASFFSFIKFLDFVDFDHFFILP